MRKIKGKIPVIVRREKIGKYNNLWYNGGNNDTKQKKEQYEREIQGKWIKMASGKT